MTKSAFRLFLVWALCLFGSGYALAAPIAYVHELTGNLAVQYGSGAPQSLKIGSTIEPGGVLSTGAASNAVVKFEDGQLMVMQANTRFAVRQYDYIKTNVAKSSAVFELLKGGLRFVTGVIGATNRNAFKLTAGTATIGIRGTDGTVIYDAIANAITAAVNAGALALQTPLGITAIPTGNFASSTPNAPPVAAAPIA
ncbi:MAG: FecR family protein, partial [Burkholderiales bacterium]